MIRFAFFYLVISISVSAQTDWIRWEAADISYELQKIDDRKYGIDDSNPGTLFLTGFQSAYYFFISDLDGDNCPFYPSCSVFFVESVKETNIFQGALMFADRFTRDTNFYKRPSHYPRHPSCKLFDPYYNYTLDRRKIIYAPNAEIVKN